MKNKLKIIVATLPRLGQVKTMKTNDKLEGLKKLHTSRRRGYVSRKHPDGVLEDYKGRFGEGYALLTPCYDSTQYCYVTYFVK